MNIRTAITTVADTVLFYNTYADFFASPFLEPQLFNQMLSKYPDLKTLNTHFEKCINFIVNNRFFDTVSSFPNTNGTAIQIYSFLNKIGGVEKRKVKEDYERAIAQVKLAYEVAIKNMIENDFSFLEKFLNACPEVCRFIDCYQSELRAFAKIWNEEFIIPQNKEKLSVTLSELEKRCQTLKEINPAEFVNSFKQKTIAKLQKVDITQAAAQYNQLLELNWEHAFKNFDRLASLKLFAQDNKKDKKEEEIEGELVQGFENLTC